MVPSSSNSTNTTGTIKLTPNPMEEQLQYYGKKKQTPVSLKGKYQFPLPRFCHFHGR